MSGDDYFYMAFSKTPNVIDRGKLEKLFNLPDYTGYRNYSKFPEQKSELLSLEAGKVYYMETTMTNLWGYGHFTVSVKVPSNSFHLNSIYEIKRLKISHNQIREALYIKIWGAKSGTWNLVKDSKKSSSISWGASSWAVAKALNQLKNYQARTVSVEYLDNVYIYYL